MNNKLNFSLTDPLRQLVSRGKKRQRHVGSHLAVEGCTLSPLEKRKRLIGTREHGRAVSAEKARWSEGVTRPLRAAARAQTVVSSDVPHSGLPLERHSSVG